jgi:hypothetical protein
MSVNWPNKLLLAKERIDGATNIEVLGIPSARVQGGQRTVETNLGLEDRGAAGASPKSQSDAELVQQSAKAESLRSQKKY